MTGVFAVIMAGGKGERFWPLSTETLPKPFVPLLGMKTLLQQTVNRLLPLIPSEKILISIGEMHRQIAREQLPLIPKENFIIEPIGRDTAPCLAYCALHIERLDPEGVMLALPADHFIADEAAFRSTLQKGIDALPGATGVVFGITPARPETGYGYIRAQKLAAAGEAVDVIRFVEKPNLESARNYLAAGNYYWNSGMFLWKNRTLLELIRQNMPDLHAGLERLRPLVGRDDAYSDLYKCFSVLPKISIDFGIMEKASGLKLVAAEFDWDDIGNWAALERVLVADGEGNVGIGCHAAIESRGCTLYSDAGIVAVFGVSDLIVVLAHGKVLVCPKERAADLKHLIAKLGH